MKKPCKICGRKFENGVAQGICSNSCAKIAVVVRKQGHR